MGEASLSIKEQGAGGLLAQQAKVPVEGMKLLAAGKFLKDSLTLADQGVKATTKILLLKQSGPAAAEKLHEAEDEVRKLNTTVAVAEEMASRPEDENNYDQYYFELTNQKGEKVNLPAADRKALVVGMALHDKGRKTMAENKWKNAVELLLQADNSFNHWYIVLTGATYFCSTPQFLDAVDNHANLHLDICWCYFKLKDMNYLKDADWRLSKAQTFLERSYGPNQGRLLAIKGGICPEMVVFCRMLILRGILAFHSGQTAAARTWFKTASARVVDFQVSDDELSGLMAMGFTAAESRVALRACHKDPNAAISYLLKKREEAQKMREEERANAQQRKFGKTAMGKPVDMAVWKSIVDMGFDSRLVVAGLRQTDNDGPATIGILTTNPDLLVQAIAKELPYSEEKIQQVTFLGYTREQAITALTLKRGDVQAAMTHLLIPAAAAGVAVPVDQVPAAADVAPGVLPTIDANIPDTTSQDVPMTEEECKAQEAEEAKLKKQEEEYRIKRNIEDELLDAVPRDAEDYFDVDVGELGQIIAEYTTQLNK